MAIASRRKPKAAAPDPDAVYQCWNAFTFGQHRVVTYGERVRGDDEAVIAMFQYFVPDGTPQHEWPHPAVVTPVSDATDPFAQTPKYVPLDEQVESTWSGMVGLRSLKKGQRVRRDDPLVQKYPQLFQTIPRPLA